MALSFSYFLSAPEPLLQYHCVRAQMFFPPCTPPFLSTLHPPFFLPPSRPLPPPPRELFCCVETGATLRAWRGAVARWTCPRSSEFRKEIPSRSLRRVLDKRSQSEGGEKCSRQCRPNCFLTCLLFQVRSDLKHFRSGPTIASQNWAGLRTLFGSRGLNG